MMRWLRKVPGAAQASSGAHCEAPGKACEKPERETPE